MFFSVKELMREAFFSFMRFDAVIAEVLDVTVLSVGMIPFKDVPVRMSHLLAAILGQHREKYNKRSAFPSSMIKISFHAN